MHDKFTERVRKVIYLAREEAARLQHDYIGTEHLLLGVIREGEGIAATVLNNLGLDLDRIRQEVENMVSASGGTMTIGEIPFTPRAKRVLELAVEEARSLGHNYVGTEHLLLGLIREGEGVAAKVLLELGVDRKRVREETLKLLGGTPSSTPRHGARGAPRDAGAEPVRPRPHPARPRGQARPGDRAREGDRARHPGAVAPQEEQPGADRRARRGQDRDRRGPGAAHRLRRRCRRASRTSAS